MTNTDFSYLDKAYDQVPVILLMRHAERYPMVSFASHHEPVLTEKGFYDSYLLGKYLATKPQTFCLFHSPVLRCRQTAENVYKGLSENKGKGGICGEQSWLAGNYVFDRGFIDTFIGKYDMLAFLRSWFDGKFPPGIVLPVAEVALTQLAALKNQLQFGKEWIIDITHDWNISVMLEYFFKLRPENIGLPSYLDYIIISRLHNKIKMHYHGYNIEIG